MSKELGLNGYDVDLQRGTKGDDILQQMRPEQFALRTSEGALCLDCVIGPRTAMGNRR